MGKPKGKKQTRAEPKKRSAFLCDMDNYKILCGSGYTSLADIPEIKAGINKICELVSGMTIHLMENTNNGDVRVRNGLSRKVDIEPSKYMTKKSFYSAIIRQLLLEGDGNSVVLPVTNRGLLEDMVILPPGQASFVQDGYGYKVQSNGENIDPDNVLHFVINPDPNYPWRGTGYRVSLRGVADTLKQAAATKKGFMESKFLPPIIVKVDGLTEEFADKDGRKKLLSQYIETSEAGEPWMIPAEQFEIATVKPLSLTDIALPDSVRLDKRTVAAILDVPPYLLGEGEFKEEEWNNFINTRIKHFCNVIDQELTRKILISPYMYFKYNLRSLYSYDINTLSTVGSNMYTRGIMTGNEVRDWLSLSPKDGLNELVILENYIPAGMIGEQKKLNQGGE